MHHDSRYIDPIFIDMAQPDRKGALLFCLLLIGGTR
jgi:hypothetical protein